MESYHNSATEGESASSNTTSIPFEKQGTTVLTGILLEKQVLSHVLLAVAQDINFIANTYHLRPTDYGEIELWKPFQELQQFFITHQDATCFMLTVAPASV
jgi:hypothetical protein